MAAIALVLAAAAGADNVTSAPTSVTITAGEAGATIDVSITATDDDGQAGCNVDTANAASVSFSASGPLAVTPGSLSFENCPQTKSITVSAPASAAAGDYNIAVAASGGIGGSYNVSPASIAVHVNAAPPPPDTSPPVLSLPANITAEATSGGGRTVAFSASATDNVDSTVAVSCSPASGSTFPIATTTVSCSATDSATNTTNGSFQVTVQDTQGPTVSVPGNIEVGTNGSSAVVPFTATASDAVDGSLTPTCTPASGSTFGIGTTTVTCAASDSRGNPGSATFAVTVRDAAPPTLTLPANITAEATGAGGRPVSFSASATDNLDPTVAVSCSPSSGSTFPIATTTVNCSATDSASNTASGSFLVTVRDTERPTVTVPSPIEVGTNATSAVVSFTATASDTVNGSLTPTCSPASGSSFGIGTTTVTCTASDAHGNTGSSTFTVTVRDAAPPALTLPANITADATSAAGRIVSFTASANDVVDGSRPVTCTPASGSTFRIGQTAVNCNSRDSSGNTGSGAFTVTITDAAPTITVPPKQTVEAIGPSGATVTYIPAPTGSDTVDGPLTPLCTRASGATFPLGTTTVTCTATDSAGSAVSASFQVAVVDTTRPVVTPPAPATFVAEGISLSRSVPALAAYLARGRAVDIVDPNPVMHVDAPLFFPLGPTDVVYTAIDGSGNRDSATTTITIVPPPPAGQPRPPAPPPDDPPPANVTSLRTRPGNALIRLSWTAPRDDDVVRYAAFRSERTGPVVQVYNGAARSFVDRGLVNGVEYRYVVVAYDRAGNRSVGVAVLARPRLPLLLAPPDGARLSRGTTFSWRRIAGARYYNFQLFRVVRADRFVKILSAWPVTNSFRLGATWRFQGRRYRLTPGTYRWFVWPGLGPRADANFGDLLGERSFTITRSRG